MGDRERSGNTYVTGILESQNPTMSGDILNVGIQLDALNQVGTLMEYGPDGVTPREIMNTVVSIAASGCWFCGESDLT